MSFSNSPDLPDLLTKFLLVIDAALPTLTDPYRAFAAEFTVYSRQEIFIRRNAECVCHALVLLQSDE